MKTKFNLSILTVFALSGAMILTSCKDDDNNPAPVSPVAPMLSMELDHMAGNKNFHFDSIYTIASGDTIIASMFKYYISNIRLVGINNAEYAVPESYFLVNHDKPESRKLHLSNLPAGQFKGIKYILGVDSTRNVSGAQTGALSADNGMFWSWNTGYIFLKLEGTSPSIASSNFSYHIGGFQGANINYKEVELDFDGDILTLANNTMPELHIVTNVLEIFANPTTIDLNSFPPSVESLSASATIIANNYADMFRYDHIHE